MQNLMEKKVILATDLDGTFLGGDDKERADLYTYVEDSRDWLGLVFVTGRDLNFISEITENDVPRPDAIIGDVGTTVVSGVDHSPIESIDSWIDLQWRGAKHAESILGEAPHLRLQTGFGGRRLSYYYDEEAPALESAERLTAEGYDVLMSDGIYFDILPRGVQKGPTLQKFIETQSLNDNAVLVAGDTLNDRSLFETGLDGVVVANAEDRLVSAVNHLPNVHFSDRNGAAGVFDGLKRKLESLTKMEMSDA